MAKKRITREYKTLDWKFFLLAIILIAGTVFLAYELGAFKKTCNDEDCFMKSLQTCSYAKWLSIKNYNYYLYTIEGNTDSSCKIDVELKKMAEGTPIDQLIKFEGKWMKCTIPQTEITKMTSANFDNMLTYCTGPLKEAMYELIIEKLYTIIIQNMGSIMGAVEDTLTGQI